MTHDTYAPPAGNRAGGQHHHEDDEATMQAKRDHKSLIHAEHMAAHWLAVGNAARERGDLQLAEKHYAKAQNWLDKANALAGNN